MDYYKKLEQNEKKNEKYLQGSKNGWIIRNYPRKPSIIILVMPIYI